MTLNPHPDVEVLSSRRLYEGRVFDLVQQELVLPSGLHQDWGLIEHPGAVAIAAVGEDGKMLLVHQFRPAANGWTEEIPAGRLDPGEVPLEAAKRELEEETGYRADRWRELCSFMPAPGFCSEVLYLFEAQGLSKVPDGGLACDEDEEIEVRRRAPEELLELSPLDAKTVIAAQTLLLERH